MARKIDRAWELQEEVVSVGLAIEVFSLTSGWHARIFGPNDATIGLGIEHVSKESAIEAAIADGSRRHPAQFARFRR